MANTIPEKHFLVFQDPTDKYCRGCWICNPSSFVKANYRDDQINQLKENNIIKRYEIFGFNKDKVYASMQRKVNHSNIKFCELVISSSTNLDELDKKTKNKFLKLIYEDDCSPLFKTNHLIFEFDLENLHEFDLSEGTNIKDEIKIKLATIFQTKSSSVNIDAIIVNTNNITLCGTIKNINFEKVRKNISSLGSFEQAHVHYLLVHPKFDPIEDLDKKGDRIFNDELLDIGIGPLGNEKMYRSPEGYRRFGLSVLDRYGNDRSWLTPFGTTLNWHRGYLLKDYVNVNRNIFPSNDGNDDPQTIYFTTDIDVLNNFVHEFNGFNIAIQVCIDPNDVQYSEEFPNIGKVNNPKSVRPYGILIK